MLAKVKQEIKRKKGGRQGRKGKKEKNRRQKKPDLNSNS